MTKPHTRNRSNSPRNRPGKSRRGGSGDWLWGQHAVAAAMANPKRQLVRLVATKIARQRLELPGAKPDDIAPHELNNLLPAGAVHQGIAAQVKPLNTQSIEEIIASGTRRVAVLDQVSDPHNLGAIFRSAAAFGFGALVLQTRNAPDITGVVAKSAAGAIETVVECRAVNIARALETLGDAGFHTVGLAGSGRASLDQAVHGAEKTAIVLGAEGPGLRPAVAKACAELAHIPIGTQMESLNVSNAAAIAFYETARASTEPPK